MNVQALFTNWNLLRWGLLMMGIAIIFHAIEAKDPLIGIIAVLLIYQAIANVGCCGANNCDIPTTKNKNAQLQEPEYDELK